MKLIRAVSIIIFMSIGLLSMSQVGTFTKMFTSNSYDEGIAAFRMPNKTYRLIANTGAWGWGSNNIWYIVLDSNANFVRHKTMGYGAIDKATAATMDSKGNIYIVGYSTSDANNSYQMLLVALDSSGALLYQKYFGGSDWDFGNGISMINDTTLILVGETYSYANQQSNAWVLKVKNSGDIIWSKSFGGSKKEAFYAVDEAKNGDLICVGNSQSYGNGSFDPYMIRSSSNGDSLESIILKDSTDGCFLDVKVGKDSTYYVGGYQRDTLDAYSDFLLHHYSKDNQFLWSGDFLLHYQDGYYNTMAFHDNNLLAFGMNTKHGSSGKNIYCDKINANNGVWMKGFVGGDKGDESAYSVSTDTSNNQTHYLIIGTSTSYNMVHTGVYFMRTNYDLEFDTTMVIDFPSAIEPIIDNKSSFDINYNIADNNLIINKLNSKLGNYYSVKVYDILGKCVFSGLWNTYEASYSINTNSWSKSVYFVVIESDEISFSHKIIK